MEITENSTDQLNQKQEKKMRWNKTGRLIYTDLTVGNKIRVAEGEMGGRVR